MVWVWVFNREFGIRYKSALRSTHIEKKASHCMAIWNTPSSPAKQANPLISRQQATSCAVDGNTRILAKAEVPDVTPRRIKYGEIPKELRRAMIRMCWGRYERRIPRIIWLWYVSDWGLILILGART